LNEMRYSVRCLSRPSCTLLAIVLYPPNAHHIVFRYGMNRFNIQRLLLQRVTRSAGLCSFASAAMTCLAASAQRERLNHVRLHSKGSNSCPHLTPLQLAGSPHHVHLALCCVHFPRIRFSMARGRRVWLVWRHDLKVPPSTIHRAWHSRFSNVFNYLLYSICLAFFGFGLSWDCAWHLCVCPAPSIASPTCGLKLKLCSNRSINCGKIEWSAKCCDLTHIAGTRHATGQDMISK
jgi:hypothetical protein